MEVTVDNLWSSPSTLHMRVTVWPNSRVWRQKFDVAVPLADIPLEAVLPLLTSAAWSMDRDSVAEQPTLF
jgi:hypothetical protein